ncbi:MAG: enoyl-CoA hydratase-related protein [Tranquillimonas sp.]
MRYETIRQERMGDAVVLTLDRPQVKNALNAQMRAELTHALRQAGAEARAVVLTGAGDAFCSGQDLGDARGRLDLERVLRDEYQPLLRAVVDCPVPTLAAVNGAAAGAGANLALCCDVAVASDRAVFVQAFARIGLVPDAGGTYWLPRQMGLAKAMGAALFGEPVTARQADDWGMIWRAVPEAEFDAEWRARATALATGPTAALTATKQALRRSFVHTLEEQLALEAHLQGEMGQTRDFKEGLVAFAEKRAPRFEGR